MCGEHTSGNVSGVSYRGSSPRVRGTPGPRLAYRNISGIIPACAGNTSGGGFPIRPAGDHPRVCGEHLGSFWPGETMRGSSPRVRGTLNTIYTQESYKGIIPACAGNTPRGYRRCEDTGDHPRVCGEHPTCRPTNVWKRGSSPRVRGTLSRSGCQAPWPGIIPACAGNTSWPESKLTLSRDHPRVCGEHLLPVSLLFCSPGSSPRVRGTPVPRVPGRWPRGIIPACAGNTRAPRPHGPPERDHPRVCGEHLDELVLLDLVDLASGSSPRVRGTPPPVGNLRNVQGIIPACAGNTFGVSIMAVPFGDHPRVCGEHAY